MVKRGMEKGVPRSLGLSMEGRMQGSHQVGAGCRHHPEMKVLPSESEVLVLEKAPEITAYKHPGESDPEKHWPQ